LKQDITFKIDPITGEDIDIKNDFKIPEEFDVNDNENDVSVDTERQENEENIDQIVLEYDQTIESIYTARNSQEYGYIAFISKMRFTIYDVYDNNAGGTEHALVWDKDYRFDP